LFNGSVMVPKPSEIAVPHRLVNTDVVAWLC
jgi:hypothetical protein